MHTGDYAWLGLISTALVVDGVLSKTHSQLLTDSARKRWPVTAGVMAVFVLHLVDVLGPADPFRLLGKALSNL